MRRKQESYRKNGQDREYNREKIRWDKERNQCGDKYDRKTDFELDR